jgi:hypothetical protein
VSFDCEEVEDDEHFLDFRNMAQRCDKKDLAKANDKTITAAIHLIGNSSKEGRMDKIKNGYIKRLNKASQ